MIPGVFPVFKILIFTLSCFFLQARNINLAESEVIEKAYHDVFVNEPPPISSWFQMWIFFSAGDFNIPNLLPSLVKLHMYRVDTRMVWGHCVAHVSRNAMLLNQTDIRCGNI